MTVARYGGAGQSSTTHGYTSGGYSSASSPTTTNIIEKFTFASDANATDVGDMSVARYYTSGQSSTAHGYTSGGLPTEDIIDKFAFASLNSCLIESMSGPFSSNSCTSNPLLSIFYLQL